MRIQVNNQPAVLFIGKSCHGEFSGALEWLRAQGDVVLQPTVRAALAWLQSSRLEPGAVVLGLTRRGEHGGQELQQLERLVPLANTIALVGSWCEGETRSGNPAQGWRRVYWHQFRRRAPGELFVTGGEAEVKGEPHPANLPKTVTENERALALSKRPLPTGCGWIAINTVRRVDYEALSKACATAGYESCWCQEESAEVIGRADYVLWDRRGLQGQDLSELLAWRDRWLELPVIATIGFPRTQDYQLVSQGLVQAIVGKPFLLAELLRALQEGGQAGAIMGRVA